MTQAAAARKTPERLEELSRFDHPLAPRISKVLGRMRSHDASSARAWVSRIEAERERLLAIKQSLHEYTGQPTGPGEEDIAVAKACKASRRPNDALSLFLLVEEFKPKRILELGTNLGISSSYLAAGQAEYRGSLTTLEGSRGRQEVAKQLHSTLGLRGIDYVLGRFADTLDSVIERPVDFAFIDGHHQYRATLDYFERIWARSEEHTIFIFDDIRWSFGMERAWRSLQKDPRLEVVVDLYGMGIGISTRHANRRPRLVTPILA